MEGKKERKGGESERGEERTETKRGGRRGEDGKEDEEAGNDRTETDGWRGEAFIRLSVCVSAGNLLFLF